METAKAKRGAGLEAKRSGPGSRGFTSVTSTKFKIPFKPPRTAVEPTRHGRAKGALTKATVAVRGRPKGTTPGVSRLAVSLDPSLLVKIQAAATSSTGGNVSAWLAEAAQQRLRHQAMVDVLKVLEETNGPVSEEAMAEVRREWLG